MKKFVSLTASVALTASMLCAPTAIVSYADQTLTADFTMVMEDQQLKPGLNEVSIPVSFDKDISFAGCVFDFDSVFFPNAAYVIEFADFEGKSDALTFDSNKEKGRLTINSNDGKDFTLKAGEVLFNINIKVMTKATASKPSAPATNVPAGATFKVALTEFDVATADHTSYELSESDFAAAYAVVQSVPEQSSADHKVKIGSVESGSKTVEVPVYVEGDVFTMRAGFKVNGSAKIVNVKSDVDGVTCSQNGSFVFTPSNSSVTTFTAEKPVATLTVQLPADAKAGDFVVSSKYFDIADADAESVYPGSVTTGTIKYEAATLAGSLTDIKINVPYIISDSSNLDLSDVKLTGNLTGADGKATPVKFEAGGDYDIKDYFEVVSETGVIERELTLKYIGPSLSSPVADVKVNYLRTVKGDIDLNGKVDVSDSTFVVEEFLENEFGDSKLETMYTGNDVYADIVTKYGANIVAEFGKKAGDVDEDASINVTDSTHIITYFLENEFEPVDWDVILKTDK